MKSLVQSFYNWYSHTLRNTKYRWVIILGTLAYLISPLDIAPDFLPIVGWIDDGMILTLLVTELSQMLLESRKKRKGGNVNEDVDQNVAYPSQDNVIDVKTL